jgi:CRP-like cAMP-binding protein
VRQENTGMQVAEIFKLYGNVHTYSPGEIIFQKGDPADKIYFVSKGLVKTYCLNNSGDEITLFYISENNTIGNEPMANIPTRQISVDSVTDVKLYSMDGKMLIEKCLSNKMSMQNLLEYFVKKIITLSNNICYTRFMKNEEKLAYFLYTNCTGDGSTVEFTHVQIASLTGMNRVSVTRLLNNFAEKKLISQQYKEIRILNRNGLADIFKSIGYLLD